MYSDAFLKLSENQTAVATGGAVSTNVIDLGVARNLMVGEPLLAVISIRTTFLAAGTDNPIAQWAFYYSDSSSQADSAYAHEAGRSANYSCNVTGQDTPPGLLVRNLLAGQKICVPLLPVTAYRLDSTTAFPGPADPTTSSGRRYLYGGIAVTGGVQFTAGKFDIDICNQAQFGGTASTSDIPTYRTGIIIA